MTDTLDLWLLPSKLQLIVSALDFYAHNQTHDCAAAIQLRDSLNKRLDYGIEQAKIRESEKAYWDSLEVEFKPDISQVTFNCPTCGGTGYNDGNYECKFKCTSCGGTGKLDKQHYVK